jgi:hypothetical protein
MRRHGKSAQKDKKQVRKGEVQQPGEENAVFKPIGYPSGRVTYPSGWSLPCQPSVELCMFGHVT